MTDLSNLVKDMALRMSQPTNTSTPVPVALPPALPSEYVPLITVAAANGMSIIVSTSLHACFPNIEVAVITAIITHKFKAANFHKLNLMNHDKEVAYTFNGATNQFKISSRMAKEYKNTFSVIIPLQRYFNMLGFHLPKCNTVPFVFYEYTAHLIELITEYEWSAVFQYHSIFFNRCCLEMAMRDYSSWGLPAMDLLSKHIYAYWKATPPKQFKPPCSPSNPMDTCCKFNNGRCTTNPCPWRCPHTCSTCSKANHGKHQHKD